MNNIFLSKEEKRIRWNKYQREYQFGKRHNSDIYIISRQIRKLARKRHKENEEERMMDLKLKEYQEKIKRITHICPQCNKVFEWKKKRKRTYCSHKCHSESTRIYKSNAEKKRAYNKRHPEMKRKHKRSGNGGIKKGAFDKMRAEYGFRCAICGRTEPFTEQYYPLLVQDHWIAKAKGGRKRSAENIVPLCWDCNNTKGDKIMDIPKPLPRPLLPSHL